MEGEDAPGNEKDPGNFNNKTPWQRLKVDLAGCFMNYVAGFLLLLFVGFTWGVAVPGDPNPPATVGALMPGYPMEKAGFQLGDKILKVNGQEISGFKDINKIISPLKDGENANMIVKRGDETLTFNVKVQYNKELGRSMLGFSPMPKGFNFQFVKAPAKDVFLNSLDMTARLTYMPVYIVQLITSKQMTAKQVGKGTAGPIGISQMLFEVSKKGIPSLLQMCAILSILIGAFNLLPIPALDGARAVFIVIEWIRKKRIDPAKEGMIHQVGFAVLMVLIVAVTYNDVLRLIRGESLFK
jgi:regulator of sigma E protease